MPVPRAIRQPIEALLRHDLARAMAAIRQIDDAATPAQMQKVANAVRVPLARVDQFATTYYLKVGRLLLEIKRRMPHGGWARLFKDGGKDRLNDPLPMSIQKGEALMRLAETRVFREPEVLKALPLGSWRTMDELTRVPAQLVRRAVKDGRIVPTMTRAAVTRLRDRDDTAQIPRARDPFVAIRLALETYDGDKEALVEFVRDWLRAMTGEVDA
jgi:hypothetical protein